MAEKSIEQRVKEIIVEQLGVNPDQVTPEAKFIEDLGGGFVLDLFEYLFHFENLVEGIVPEKFENGDIP